MIEELIGQETENIVKRIKDRIEALILVGSFARGEGITYQNNGKLEFISDIEFLAVVKNNRKINSRAISNEKISIGFSNSKTLPRLKPYIFTVETKKFGKVLCGDKNILDLIPNYEFKDIATIDGFILLNNRIVEQLILLNKIEANETIYQYDIDKGYIQLVNSLLAFCGQYKSRYKEKLDAINPVFKNIDHLNQRIPDFTDKAINALNCAMTGTTQIINPENAKIEWQKLKEYFKEIWLYEASVLLNDLSYNLDKTLNKFIIIPDLKTRIKGWAKVILRGISFGNISGIFISSPQFLIYQSAAKAYFDNLNTPREIEEIIKNWQLIVK